MGSEGCNSGPTLTRQALYIFPSALHPAAKTNSNFCRVLPGKSCHLGWSAQLCRCRVKPGCGGMLSVTADTAEEVLENSECKLHLKHRLCEITPCMDTDVA